MRKRLFNQQSEPRSRETQKTWRLSVKAKIMMALFVLMLIPQGAWAQTGSQTYLLWIGSTQVDDWNKDNVLQGDPINNGTVRYVSETSTLYLSGVNLDDDITSGEGSLKIVISGTNIIGSYKGFIKNTMSGDRSLTIVSETDGNSLTIQNQINASVQPVIEGFSSVTLEGVYVSSTTPFQFNKSTHQYEDSNGDAMTSMVFTTAPSYPLWIGSKQVTSAIKGDVLEDGGQKVSFDINTTNNINTLTLNGVTGDMGITSGLDNLTIDFSGNNTLGNSGGFIKSLNANAILTFKTSTGTNRLDIGNSKTSPSAIEGFSSVELNGAYLRTDNNPFHFNSVNKVFEGLNGGLQSIQVTSTPYYMLWVGCIGTGFTQATEGLMGNYGSGTVSFTQSGNILTLTDASIEGFIESGLDNLKIHLIGANSITESSAYTSSNKNPIYSDNNGTLTFTTDGTGSLEFLDLTPQPYTNPITYNFSSVTYNNDLAYNSTSSVIATNYNLWVDGTQVTSVNANTIAAGVSYNYTTNELTLNATNTVTVKTGLTDLNVNLVGSNLFYSTSKSVFEGVNGTEKLTFITNPSAAGSYDISAANGIFKNISTANVTYQNDLRYWKMNATYDKAQIRQSPWEGQGTSNAPFHISNTTDLTTLADYVNNGYIIEDYFDLNVVDDLDCSLLTSFSSIGKRVDNYTIYSFDGTFDGKGRKIKNLTSSYGLFAHVGGSGIITDLTLENCIVNGVLSGVGATSTNPAESAGGVVAEFRSTGKIEKCHVVGGSVSGGSNDKIYFVGGIVGVLNSGTIDQCTVENVTISEPDASRTIRQSVGGIVGTSDGGAISNCSVTINNGTSKITNFTTTAPEVYAGAIIGEGRSKVTLTNNTYSSGVEVQTQKGPAPDDAKSGNIQRGTGEADSESNWDVFTSDGAVLAGVQKVKLTVDSKGTGSISGYYRVNSNEYYSLPSCSLVVRGTPNADYDLPLLTLKRDNGVALQVFYPDNTIQGTGYVDWSFNMPNSEVEADVKFGFDLSNANRIFTIDPITYNSTSAASITAIKTKATSTSTNEFTLTVSNNDFTVTGYQDENGAALTGAPSDVGNYNVVVSGTGYNSGTVTIPFEITPQAATITATDQKVTYDGNPQALSASASSGVAVVTYYNSEDDRTNASGGFTKAPTDAKTYYVSVTQGNANYTSTAKNVTFTIDPLTATLNWTNTVFTYDGTAHVPTATVTNLIGKDACDVTVTGAETNASATSYTATATALSNNNYALPSGVTQTFTINPLAATPDVALTIPTSYVYDGTAKTPAVAVSVSGVALTTDDYSVAYTDNINAGRAAAKATVTLKRNYSGSKVETFDINPLTATLGWGNTTFVYNGTAQAPTATVTNLVGTDVCNVTVGGAETAAGSYTATATALSNANYQLPASPTTTFTILDRTATIDFGDRTFKTYYDANETFIVPDGTTAYIVTGVSGNAVTIQKVSYIKAGVPVLLESTPGSTVAKNVSETFTGNLLKYAAAATPATEKHYLLYKNEFVRASGTISNKVYLDLAGYSGGARSLVIGDGATAIEGIVIDEEDGDAKWYDMQGRRINNPTKAGLYIKDGQKVVVKTRY